MGWRGEGDMMFKGSEFISLNINCLRAGVVLMWMWTCKSKSKSKSATVYRLFVCVLCFCGLAEKRFFLECVYTNEPLIRAAGVVMQLLRLTLFPVYRFHLNQFVVL